MKQSSLISTMDADIYFHFFLISRPAEPYVRIENILVLADGTRVYPDYLDGPRADELREYAEQIREFVTGFAAFEQRLAAEKISLVRFIYGRLDEDVLWHFEYDTERWKYYLHSSRDGVELRNGTEKTMYEMSFDAPDWDKVYSLVRASSFYELILIDQAYKTNKIFPFQFIVPVIKNQRAVYKAVPCSNNELSIWFLHFLSAYLRVYDSRYEPVMDDDELELQTKSGIEIRYNYIGWNGKPYDQRLVNHVVRIRTYMRGFINFCTELAERGVYLRRCVDNSRLLWEFVIGDADQAVVSKAYLVALPDGLTLYRYRKDLEPLSIDYRHPDWDVMLPRFVDTEFYRQTHREQLLAAVLRDVMAYFPPGLRADPQSDLLVWLEAQRDLLATHAAVAPDGDGATEVEQHFHDLQL